MLLPKNAIKFVIFTVHDFDLCARAKSFINLQMKYIHVFSDLIFLQVCPVSAVILVIFSNMTRLPEYMANSKVVARTLQSLEMEILRICLTECMAKPVTLEQQRGYEYLLLTQSGHHMDPTQTFLVSQKRHTPR